MTKRVLDSNLSKTLTVDDIDAQNMVQKNPARFSIVRDALPTDPFTITPSGSPFSYTNTGALPFVMVCTGGTVSLIEILRPGSAAVTVASATGANIRVAQGDTYRVTYSVAPTLTALPSS